MIVPMLPIQFLERALKLYQNREFNDAGNIFKKLADRGDETSGVFVKRCEDSIVSPPPPEWSGVWVMHRK